MGALLRIVDSTIEISQVSSESVDAQNAKLLNCLLIVYHNPARFLRNMQNTTLADASTALFPSREALGTSQASETYGPLTREILRGKFNEVAPVDLDSSTSTWTLPVQAAHKQTTSRNP